ncbi:MAG: hypothetical protein KDC38_12720, partial [Planctomycetes bacterium]|nr:hypothetical protein [Planctomycetota bacterium]
ERLHPVLSAWVDGMTHAVRDLDRRMREARRRGRRPGLDECRTEANSIIDHAAKQLDKYQRQGERRTRHAADRTKDPDRPTASAHSDALRAADDHLYLDRHRRTVIVRGPRNRVHVFRADGTLVTSIVYSGRAIAEKLQQGRWVPLDPVAAEALRAALVERTHDDGDSP